jgi:predicted permease
MASRRCRGVEALYARIKKRLKAASDAALYSTVDMDFQAVGSAERLTGVEATGSLFQTLRVKPFLGHVFAPANDQPDRDRVVVLSYRLWQQSFGGDPHVIDRTARLDSRTYRIIGVMPPGFVFPDHAVDFWKPLIMTSAQQATVRWNLGSVFMLARLKPGMQIETAQGELHSVLADVSREVSPENRQFVQSTGARLNVEPYHRRLVSDRQASLLLLEGTVLLVLLITCVNVANLLLSQSLGRGHEMAMRAALGATRPRLARQLLVEGLCLAVPGGLAGLGLGWVCLMLLKQSSLVGSSSIFTVAPDWRVGLFALAAVIAAGILVSLLPICHLTRTDLQTLLQAGGRSATGGRGAKRTRGALVVVELALATALLAGAGLLLHSFVKIASVNTGFNTDNVLTAGLLVSPKDHPSDQGLANLYREVVKKARALPGVEHAGLVHHLPFADEFQISSFKIPGRKTSHGPQGSSSAAVNRIDSGYFKALGLPILRGRGFTPQDTMNSRPVAVIDTRMAKTYFKHRSPIGQQLKFSAGSVNKLTIVGVVPAITSEHLDKRNPYKEVYVSAFQHPLRTMHLALKTGLPPETLVHSAARFDPTEALQN